MPRFDAATCNNIIGRLQVGQSQTEVAQQFNNVTPLAEMKSNWISSTRP
jgi:hypothetical protein